MGTQVMDLSLLLPTRKRIHNVKRLLESIHKTMSHSTKIEVIFYVDNDDEDSQDYLEDCRDLYEESLCIEWIIGPRIAHMGKMTNLLYERSKAKIVGLIGDDVVFRTIDWDTSILNEFAKYKDNILYLGNIDLLNDNIFCHPFMHKSWVDVVGYLVPDFKGDYIDTFLYDVATRIGRAVRLPIVIEHMHFSHPTPKAVMDDVMREKLTRCYNSGKPSNVEFDESKVARDEAVAKLTKYIEENK